MRLLAACVVSAVSGVAAVSALAAPSGAPSVVCGSIVVPGEVGEWKPKRVVLGVVAVPPAHIPQTVPSDSTRWPYWSKAGMVVRANSPPVTVSVPPAWRTRVSIGWGNVDGRSSVRFEPCPDSSTLGGWNPYSGGFQLRSRAACVPLKFSVAGRSATVRFGVGKRCA